MLNDDFSLFGLFISAFLSSTLLPGGSEVVLAYLSSAQQHPVGLLLIVATAGNTLGGISSWAIGWLIAKKYPLDTLNKHFKPEQQKAVMRVQQYGSPVLLLSWLPIVGDPLCVAAGWLRIHWLTALLFIAAGKALRYGVILTLF